MPARKSSSRRRYGRGASKSVKSAMHRAKRGTLRRGKSGHGGKVTSRKQAIAIGLSEARKKGAKVPRKRSSRSRPSGDPQTLDRRLPSVLEEEEPQDRPPPQPRHVQDTSRRGEARAGGSILQARVAR